jgi:hypothetical protein
MVASILARARMMPASELRHFLRIEPGEALAERRALLEHGDPGQSGLKTLQHQHLP